MLHNPIHEDVKLDVEQGFTLTHRVLAEEDIPKYTVKYTIDHWTCNDGIIRILGETDVINGILILNSSITEKLHGIYMLNVRYYDDNSPEILTETIHVNVYK